MQARTRGVGEHVHDEELRFGGFTWILVAEGCILLPELLPVFVFLGEWEFGHTGGKIREKGRCLDKSHQRISPDKAGLSVL
jgi:hypothetical protein